MEDYDTPDDFAEEIDLVFYHSKLRKLQKLLWRLACVSGVDLGPETNYQATREVLLNKMLKPFAIPPFNIIQQPFNSVQQNRTDVEANVEAIC